MIIVSELGDKTFFIAAIMAMRHSRATSEHAWPCLAGLSLLFVRSILLSLGRSCHYDGVVISDGTCEMGMVSRADASCAGDGSPELVEPRLCTTGICLVICCIWWVLDS